MKTLSHKTAVLIKFFGLALITLTLSACSLTGSSGRTGLESSVFLSTDGGSTWREAVTMASTGQPQNIRSLSVNKMVMDPQDNLAVYLASVDSGLYYTYNVIQDGWLKAKNLPGGTIRDVQVDPKNKCIIYAAIGNQIFSTQDCSRTWEQIYFDNNTGVTVNTIAIDHYNPRNLYIGTSRGEIIKSIDAGNSWRTIRRLDEGISQLIVSPLDSRIIFIASERNRIFSFTSNTNTNPADSGDIEANFVVNNWLDLNAVLKDFDLGRNFRDFVICNKDGKMFIATNQTILRSADQGITWEKINLIQPEKDAIVNALAVDPQNSDNLFYVTNTTFFRSTDGGVTWSTRKLPTSRAGRALLVDFKNPNNIYLGTIKLK